ncbi:MAG: uroporphyrinogen decarboxylase family protein [Clostridia bacterium]
MTGRERVARAMHREQADRVPVFCQLSIGHYMLRSEVPPHKIWFSTDDFTNTLVKTALDYNFDGILVNLPGRPSGWEDFIAAIDKRKGETVIDWKGGGQTVCPDADNAHYSGPFTRPCLDEVDPSLLYYLEPHCITELSYPFSFDFMPPSTEFNTGFFPDYYLDSLKLTLGKVKGQLHVSSEVFSPFTQFMELLGYSDGLIALMDDPEKCERILESLARGTADLAVMQADAGADAVLVSSAFAGGGFISTDQYRRFVLPFEKFVVDRVHRRSSVPIYVHTCGSIADRIGLMVEAGYDGVDTMDPPPLGNVHIAEVKKEYGNRIFLKGNLDPVNVLLNGTPETVKEGATELIRTAGVGGGYILSTACSVSPATPARNIAVLSETSTGNPYQRRPS